MDKVFKLKENGTSVKTEIIAGLTTFMTMAYIIALNPNILAGYGFTDGGMELWNAVLFLATCLASGIAMVCMAFIANKPFCLAPGMGLMLMEIGFGSNVYIANSDGQQFFMLKDFFGSLTATFASQTMGDAYPVMVLSVVTAFVGLFVIALLAHKGAKACVLIGMLVASLVY